MQPPIGDTMKHFIEADGEGPVAVREPRRGLQSGAPLGDLDDRASPGGLAAREGEPGVSGSAALIAARAQAHTNSPWKFACGGRSRRKCLLTAA